MKENFCCVCGKPGKWPVCQGCEKIEPLEEPRKKKKKGPIEHHLEYFEAIVQNRAGEGAEKELWKMVPKIQEKRKFKAWKKGNDFYFSDIKAARIAAKSVVKSLNLKIGESRKQTGYDRHKGAKKYKWNICIRDTD